MKKSKTWKWRIFFCSLYSLVIVFNFLGYDDLNILLFLTSPPLWITETHWFVVNVFHTSEITNIYIYAATFLFWFVLGFLADLTRKKLTKDS